MCPDFSQNNCPPARPLCSHGGAVAEPCHSGRQESCSQAGSLPGVPRVGLVLLLCLLRVFALLMQLQVLSLCFPVSCSLLKYKFVRHLSVTRDAEEMGQSLLWRWCKFLVLSAGVKPSLRETKSLGLFWEVFLGDALGLVTWVWFVFSPFPPT